MLVCIFTGKRKGGCRARVHIAPACLDAAYGGGLIREVYRSGDDGVISADVEHELIVDEDPKVVISAEAEDDRVLNSVRALYLAVLGKVEVKLHLRAEAEVIGIALIIR